MSSEFDEEEGERRPAQEVVPVAKDKLFDAMLDLQALLLADVTERIRSGQATAPELVLAQKILKENGVTFMPVRPLRRDGTAPRIGEVLAPDDPQRILHLEATPLPDFDDEDEQ